MATKTEYNPLLKKGFQDINDTSAIETEISNLQRDITAAQELITTLQSLLETLQGNVTTVQNNVTTLQGNVTTVQNNVTTLQTSTAKLQANKITKCASSAKLADLTDGEIFQWQAADTADFKNGYFYAVAKTELPVGSSYYQYPSGQQTIIQNGYNFAPGNYYVISEPDVEGSNFSDYRLYQYRNTEYYVVLTSNQTLAVGDTVWDEANKLSFTVTAIDGSNVTLSNGATFSKDSSTGSSFTSIYNCKNAAGEDFTIIQTGVGKMVVHYTLSNNIFTLLDFFTVGFLFLWETTSPTSISAYTQTDTQPQYTLLPATSTQLGGVMVGDGLSIADGVLSGLRNIANTEQGDVQIDTNLKVVGSIAQFSVSWTDIGVATSGFTAAFIDALLNYIHTNFSNKQFIGLIKPNNVRSAIGNCYAQNNNYYTTMLIFGVDGSLCFLHESSNVWKLDDITKTEHPF